MRKRGLSFLLSALFLVFDVSLDAQSVVKEKPQGAFPEAYFHGDFNKRLENDIFRPFFVWEGRMGLDMVVYRRGKQAVFFKNEFLTVGGDIIQNRVYVIGTSYLLEGRYQFSVSRNVYLGGGWSHNSSHLTQDLTELIQREIGFGRTIPQINTSDLNVVFGEIKWSPSFVFQPEIIWRIQPLNFQGLRGNSFVYDRLVYMAVEETLWSGKEKRLIIATQHEIGQGGFSDFSARLELFTRDQKEGRLQLLVGGSPGSGLHMSTNYPWYKNGLRVGLRVVFEAK